MPNEIQNSDAQLEVGAGAPNRVDAGVVADESRCLVGDGHEVTTLTVCNNHPERGRDLTLFRYVDAHGVVYEMHLCPECAADERGTYEWKAIDGGFELRRPLALE